MEEKRTSLAVPIAIVAAGVLIAGAVYFSNKGGPTTNSNQNLQNPNDNQSAKVKTGDIAINPVSQKDYIRGNPSAKVVIVEYSDTECPFCKQFHGTMKNLTEKLAKDSTVAWVYRHFPIIKLHPKAPKEAESTLCAGKIAGNNGFWDYIDRLFAITPSNNNLDLAQLPAIAKDVDLDETMFNTCLSSGEMAPTVDLDYQDGIKAGGTGTPFSVFVVNKPFNKKDVEEFLAKNISQYRFPPDLFEISNDNKRVSVSGSMPIEFMEGLVEILAK